MISSKNLYIGAALGLVLAAGTGFGIARLTAPTAEAPVTNAQVAAGHRRVQDRCCAGFCDEPLRDRPRQCNRRIHT